jgi:hypothetical protein
VAGGSVQTLRAGAFCARSSAMILCTFARRFRAPLAPEENFPIARNPDGSTHTAAARIAR